MCNVCERMEVVEREKKWSPPFPCCPVSRQCPSKKTVIEEKNLFTEHFWMTASADSFVPTKVLSRLH